jgi:hypothetical protein
MPSRGKKPDRLEGVAGRRLIDALEHCRQAVIHASTKVKVMGPVYQGCHMVRAAIDALATLITGSKYYFHSQAMPGDKTWYKDLDKRGE